MSESAPVDPSCCPLCGAANRCAMETERVNGLKQSPCWCMTTHIDEEILQRIPDERRGLACICASCAARVER